MDGLDFALLLFAVFAFVFATFSVAVVIGRTINLVALGLLLVTLVAFRSAAAAVF